VTIDDLRRHAVVRSLFPRMPLRDALEAIGFVQADPIRAPARAQDLILHHRVVDYRAGDLERHYPRLGVHEDVFINYGFVTDRVFRLMHPRRGRAPWSVSGGRHATRLLEFIRVHGPVHPRQVDEHFSLGTVTNYWGGRRMPRRTFWIPCITVVCFEWRAASPVSGCTSCVSPNRRSTRRLACVLYPPARGGGASMR
jgi:uncharacterized protein YcaQ